MYKYEMHIHSCACSACARSDSLEIVDAAKKGGYSGLVFTNHFYHGNTAIDRALEWKDFVMPYYEDYLKAREYGKTIDIDVLFGIEEGYGKGKEALIYGVDPLIIANTPKLAETDIEFLSSFVRENGGFIACAHPFRDRGYITDADEEPDMRYFDAVEVYNQHNSDEDNKKAEEFVIKNNLKTISGGDHHIAEEVATSKAGIVVSKRIRDEKELVRVLKSDSYSCAIPSIL